MGTKHNMLSSTGLYRLNGLDIMRQSEVLFLRILTEETVLTQREYSNFNHTLPIYTCCVYGVCIYIYIPYTHHIQRNL